MWDDLFWLGLASCAFYWVRFRDSLIINKSEKNQVILVFLDGDGHQGKVAPEIATCWLILACCVSHPIRLKNSLISNKTGEVQLISLIFCMEIIIRGRYHLRLLLLVGCGQVCSWANQILEFFDYQYIWKESINTSDWPLSIILIYFAFFIK